MTSRKLLGVTFLSVIIVLILSGGIVTNWGQTTSIPLSEGMSEELRETVMNALMRYNEGGYIETSALYAIDVYWQMVNKMPSDYGLDTQNSYVFLVFLDLHAGTLPDYGILYPQWGQRTLLRVDNGREYIATSYKWIVDSGHHQTAALAFPKVDESGKPVIGEGSHIVDLIIKGLEEPNDTKVFEWQLPLLPEIRGSPLVAGSLWTVLPILGGLLVLSSPCYAENAIIYAGVIGAVGTSEPSTKTNKSGRKGRLLIPGLLFVAGNVAMYTMAGVTIGYTGQVLQQNPIFSQLNIPFTVASGALLIYFGAYFSGLWRRIPFPFRVSRLTNLMSISHRFGGPLLMGVARAGTCLACFRGILVLSMLSLAWLGGSALMGGLMLLTLSLSLTLPLILVVFFADKASAFSRISLRLFPYLRVSMGAFLVASGILTLAFGEHVFINGIYDLLWGRGYGWKHT